MATSPPSQSPRRTASTCTPETARGTHTFRIEGYSLFRDLGIGKCVQSATFSVGGYDWSICFYPDGDREEEGSKDWASAYLVLKTNDAEVRAIYDLTLVDQATTPPPSAFRWPNPSLVDPVVFDNRDVGSDCTAWGYNNFIRKSELVKDSPYVLDDAIVIECSLVVPKLRDSIVAAKAKMNTETILQVPPSALVDNLSALLDATEGSDVSFNVKEEVFPGHKIILAMRSPVFRAEFFGPMSKEGRRTVTIEDMQPAVFRGLLHFIYKDSLPSMSDLNVDEHEEMVRHLLVAADRYAIERMKSMCESVLCKSLYAKTVATTLALADQHHCSKLKDACIEFMNSLVRMDDVVASKGYQHLKRSCPAIIVDIWERTTKARRN